MERHTYFLTPSDLLYRSDYPNCVTHTLSWQRPGLNPQPFGTPTELTGHSYNYYRISSKKRHGAYLIFVNLEGSAYFEILDFRFLKFSPILFRETTFWGLLESSEKELKIILRNVFSFFV